MSVAEIGQLHSRYVRLSDKFKAVWTFNQLVTGVFKNLLGRDVPHDYDFQQLYEQIRKAGEAIQTASPSSAGPLMDRADTELDHAVGLLIATDAQVAPSILRRFFERLRRQDEKILFNVIKFYLYARATAGEQRDKLDFLLTRVAEVWVDERSEYAMKERSEFRRTIAGLLNGMEFRRVDPAVVADLAREFDNLRDQINGIDSFEELTSSSVLARGRELKQQVGEAYFEPDLLLSIIECNIATKNRFARLYQKEETRLVEDAQRLLENEQSIAHGFGEDNPELLEEIGRFKEFKKVFDESRAESNVKHDLISSMKGSLARILARLEERFDPESDIEDIGADTFMEPRDHDTVRERFGDDPVLQPFLVRIISILESVDLDSSHSRIANDPAVQRLRLEPWEISAFEKLYWDRPRSAGERDDLLYLYVRGAALRLRIDEEARDLAESRSRPAPETLERVRETLERAREFDESFKGFLQEQIHAGSNQVHRVYRSRLRLLRAYSGLWLIYDQNIDHQGN